MLCEAPRAPLRRQMSLLGDRHETESYRSVSVSHRLLWECELQEEKAFQKKFLIFEPRLNASGE